MNGLPSGWDLTTLDGLLDREGVFADGDWVETKDQDPDGEVRLIQLADIGDGVFRDRSSRFLTAAKAKELRCTFLEPGDVLIARMPEPLGRACLFPGTGQPAVTAVDVCIVRPGPRGCNNRWLMHAVNAPQFRTRVTALQSGTTRKRISRRNLATIKIPVPPLAEQRRIVEAIEEQFSRLDAADRLLLRALSSLEKFEAATLGDVLRGGPNDGTKEGVALTQLASGWHWKSLGHLLASHQGLATGPFGTLVSKSDHRSSGVAVLGIQNLVNGTIRGAPPYFLDPEKAAQLTGYRVQKGDLVVSRSGTVGQVAVVPREVAGHLMSTNLIRIRLAEPFLAPWVALSFRASPTLKRQINDLCKGSTRPFLNGRILRQLRIGVPPYEDMAEGLEAARVLLEEVLAARREVERAVIRGRSLRRGLLDAAFSGRLVPRITGSDLNERVGA